jgi:TRAP-type C4-dicarboxylate transport system permease small subunit
MTSIFSTVSRGFTKIENALFYLAAAVLVAIVLTTCLDVGMRYLAHKPLVWSYPLTNTYLMPALFVFALSASARHGDHISMDIVRLRMSRRAQRACELISLAASFMLMLPVAIFGMLPLLEAWTNDERLPGEDWVLWPAYAIVPIGFGVLACRFLVQFAETMTRKRTATEGPDQPHVPLGVE